MSLKRGDLIRLCGVSPNSKPCVWLLVRTVDYGPRGPGRYDVFVLTDYGKVVGSHSPDLFSKVIM